MKGTINSVRVQKTLGSRIRAARNHAKLSRNEFAELLLQNKDYPEITPRKVSNDITTPSEKLVNRIKQWERGENPVGLEFIPAICDVLRCDVGYLFGEYDEHNRAAADICLLTGLSEDNVNRLLVWQQNSDNRLKTLGNIYIEAANRALVDFLFLNISSENHRTFILEDKNTENNDWKENLRKEYLLTEDAKKAGYTILGHKDAIRFYTRSMATQLERLLEEVYIDGID